MKKYLYYGFLALFTVMIVLIIAFRKKDTELPVLKARKAIITNSSEWVNTKEAIEGLLTKLRTHPEDMKSTLQLAQAYIQESRVTGDHAYYDIAALQLLNKILEKEPDNFEALCSKASIFLSQHHFADALPVADKAVTLNPYNSFIYGIYTDAYVELGKYDSAITMADKMVMVRPDIRSYSRISYLREIMGDVTGAKEAMKLALSAGVPGLEQSEWCRVQLGHLYEKTGMPDSAQMQYEMALYNRPNYPYALAGMGSIEKSKMNYKSAISYYEKADGLINEYSFGDELIDLYRITDPKKCWEQVKKVLEKLNGEAQKGNSDEQMGHYADRELAYVYLKAYNYPKALEHALIEYNRRPANIDVNETLAWVYFKLGEYADANKYIDVAMKTHSQNPVLLYRAGIIKINNGEKDKGMELMKRGLQINPDLPIELKWVGEKYFAS